MEKTKHQLLLIKLSEEISHSPFLSHFQAYSLFLSFKQIYTLEYFMAHTLSPALIGTDICLHLLSQNSRATIFSSTFFFFLSFIISLSSTINLILNQKLSDAMGLIYLNNCFCFHFACSHHKKEKKKH